MIRGAACSFLCIVQGGAFADFVSNYLIEKEEEEGGLDNIDEDGQYSGHSTRVKKKHILVDCYSLPKLKQIL